MQRMKEGGEMNKGLTSAYMIGYHSRDDEVRALEDRLDEARREVESAHELATEFLIPRAEDAERRARVFEGALARCVIYAKRQTILPITGDQLRDLCIAEAEAEEESNE